MNTFSIEQAISTGWNAVKKNFLFILGVEAFSIVWYFISSFLPTSTYSLTKSFILYIIILLIVYIAQFIIDIGYMRISLTMSSNNKPQWSELFQIKSVWKYFLASILMGLIVLGGLILFIIPGFYFAFRLSLTGYFVIDQDLGPIEAIKKSWHTTKGNILRLIGLGFVGLLIIIVGALLLGFGLIVAIPLVAIATASAYRQITTSKETTPIASTQPAVS